jgi:hypothetical protein
LSERTQTYRERQRAHGRCAAGPHVNPESERFVYCRACRLKNAARSRRHHERLATELATCTAFCAYSKCQREFTPHRRRAGVPWTVTCSPDCAHLRTGELARARGMAEAHEGRRRAAAAKLREEVSTLTTAGEIAAYRLGFARGFRRAQHRYKAKAA